MQGKCSELYFWTTELYFWTTKFHLSSDPLVLCSELDQKFTTSSLLLEIRRNLYLETLSPPELHYIVKQQNSAI